MTLQTSLPAVRTALQINMHPFDAPHVAFTLPHQLRSWSGQVDRVLVTVDTGQVGAGRYKGDDFEQAKLRLFRLLEDMRETYPQLCIDTVDYGQTARQQVGRQFFSQSPNYPAKAFDGGPFYVYFYGLMRANAQYVLHMDSDMLFGGGSQTWIADAIGMLESNPDALVITPFSGPPTTAGDLDLTRHVGMPGVVNRPSPRKLEADVPTWRFPTVSTRIFLLDTNRFAERIGSLELLKPDFKRQLRSYAYNQQPISMPAEEVLSINMIQRRLSRLDYLGRGSGMYTLHPPYRSPEFYRALPGLIERIEKGDIPEGQRGDFDINASMLDWSSALAAKTRTKRYTKALKHLIAANYQRFSRR